METVVFEHVEKKGASFATTRADGSLLVVESGKPYSTDDPNEIRELDLASHAVKRVKAED